MLAPLLSSLSYGVSDRDSMSRVVRVGAGVSPPGASRAGSPPPLPTDVTELPGTGIRAEGLLLLGEAEQPPAPGRAGEQIYVPLLVLAEREDREVALRQRMVRRHPLLL